MFPAALPAHSLSKPRPGWYRHYLKGDLYCVWGNVKHTETSEIMVLYTAVRPGPEALQRNPGNLPFVRPRAMFVGRVEHDGCVQPRFAPVTTRRLRLRPSSSKSPCHGEKDHRMKRVS
jgi:hypothetical protein